MNILITGATGTIGNELLKIVLRDTNDHVTTIMRKPIDNLYSETGRINQISTEDFFETDLTGYGVLLHLAFARANKGNAAIAESLAYTGHVFTKAVSVGIPRIIYISSQSVYGSTPFIREVNMTATPSSVYAMAKYAGELLLKESVSKSRSKYNILRLDNVIESQNLIKALCKSAIQNHSLSLKGGKQVFSYISANDAAKAIFMSYRCLLKDNMTYNVGPNRMQTNLVEIGEIVKSVALERGNSIQVSLQEDDTELWAGMDSQAFSEETGWQVTSSLYEMVREIYIQTECSM